ncbi:MAG: PRC-barrel domain-containing protein [Patescibacteria group bacterium]
MPLSLNCFNIPVYTQSDIYLGRITGIEIDPATWQVVRLVVKNKAFNLPLLNKNKTILISPRQVISLSKTKMIVADTTVKNVDLDVNLAASITV